MNRPLPPRPLARPLVLPPMLSRGGVDQDHLSRSNPSLIDELLADDRTRLIVVHGDRGLIARAPDTENSGTDQTDAGTEQPVRLAVFTPAAVPESIALVYLGRSTVEVNGLQRGTSFIAAVVDDQVALTLAPVLPHAARWASLRTVGARLGDVESTLLTQAVAIGRWHADHRFSPLSGRPLRPEKAGWVLRSEPDEPEQFPRTDPAIIVAVTDADDRLLLGSNALWQAGRFSLLAGFVEPGESLESAVQREIFEESGIRVIDPVYLGSQPWPYPRSLMIGFHALADPSVEQQLKPDGEEILELRWFTRDELERATDVILPGSTSIARRIIESWLGRTIEDDRW